jgi:hypothetical protein
MALAGTGDWRYWRGFSVLQKKWLGIGVLPTGRDHLKPFPMNCSF